MKLRPRHPVLTPLRAVDERLKIAKVGRTAFAYIFPDHWSFMLGEVALYSFMILVATGTYLAMFFEPSTAQVLYKGAYQPMHGEFTSEAYASTLKLSFDVRGGLLIRQVHHWSAHLFIGAIVLHVCRIFFTAMFRKPRELNWMVGVTLLILAIANAFFGYSLPDDLLSGTGLHIFWSIALSIPVVGAWLSFLFFNGLFPGESLILRLFTIHILIIPALIAILIGVHLAMIMRQHHSHFSGPGRRNANTVGSRMWPTYALRSLGLLFAVAAVSFFLGGFAQINPIWVWGDYEPATILEPSVADWYIAWIEGALRMFPPVEFTIFGYLVPEQFFAGVLLPALTFGALYAWPFIDKVITGDRATHHITGRPREYPLRTAIGVTALTFFTICLCAAGEELLSEWTGWPLGTIRAVERGLVLGLPIVFGVVAYQMARALRDTGKKGILSLSGRDILPLRRQRVSPAAMEPATPEETTPATRAAPEGTVPVAGAVPGAALAAEESEEAAGDGRPLVEPASWLVHGHEEKAVAPRGVVIPAEAAPSERERELSETPTWLGGRKKKGSS